MITVYLFAVLFKIIMKLPATHEQAQYFTETPPPDYYHRESLADCPRRFYAGINRYNNRLVYGGTRAIRGEFRHMVAIGWTTQEGVNYLCGGSLITPNYVLTAAHCAINSFGIEPDTVRLGDTDLNSSEDDEFAQQIKIRQFKKHPQYRHSRNYFDIALIELESSAESSEAVCSACLWLEKDVPSEMLSAVGFGASGFAENLSPTLQKVNLTTYNNTECSSRVPTDIRSLPKGLLEAQFCAGGESKDTCEGDSGGPIQTERINVDYSTIPLLVGLISFGTPCTEGSTGVYTRVASYRHWIETETNRTFDYSACVRNSNCSYRKIRRIGNKYPALDPVHRIFIGWTGRNLSEHHCGATLIDYRFAITSASCVSSKSVLPDFIGSRLSEEKVRIENIYIHPGYKNGENPENDIALVKLAMYLIGQAELLPACLWPEAEIKLESGNMYYSARSSGEHTNRLLIETKIIDNGRCTEQFQQRKNLLCAKNRIPLIPTVCEMDYGGPISTNAYTRRLPYLYGVVSNLSTGCGDDLIGTRLYPHIDWIENTVLDHTHERLVLSP